MKLNPTKILKSITSIKIKTSTLLILIGLLTVVIIVAGLGTIKEGYDTIIIALSAEQIEQLKDLKSLTDSFSQKMSKLQYDIQNLQSSSTSSNSYTIMNKPSVIRDMFYVFVSYHGKEKYNGDIYYKTVYEREENNLFSRLTPPEDFIMIKRDILDVATAYSQLMMQVDKMLGITYNTSAPSSLSSSSSSSSTSYDKLSYDELKKRLDNSVDDRFSKLLKDHEKMEKELYKNNLANTLFANTASNTSNTSNTSSTSSNNSGSLLNNSSSSLLMPTSSTSLPMPIDTSLSATSGFSKSEIPPGSEDLYILKSQIVVPTCPVSSNLVGNGSKCNTNAASTAAPVPPCPPCERCPEPAFDCKKIPNYNALTGRNDSSYLPRPVLTDFSQFGM
jgi:hypothetical protein